MIPAALLLGRGSGATADDRVLDMCAPRAEKRGARARARALLGPTGARRATRACPRVVSRRQARARQQDTADASMLRRVVHGRDPGGAPAAPAPPRGGAVANGARTRGARAPRKFARGRAVAPATRARGEELAAAFGGARRRPRPTPLSTFTFSSQLLRSIL